MSPCVKLVFLLCVSNSCQVHTSVNGICAVLPVTMARRLRLMCAYQTGARDRCTLACFECLVQTLQQPLVGRVASNTTLPDLASHNAMTPVQA